MPAKLYTAEHVKYLDTKGIIWSFTLQILRITPGKRALLRRGMTDEQINARLQENGAADLIQCTQLEDGGIVYQEFFNSEELDEFYVNIDENGRVTSK